MSVQGEGYIIPEKGGGVLEQRLYYPLRGVQGNLSRGYRAAILVMSYHALIIEVLFLLKKRLTCVEFFLFII
jgi:hypothetical protein